MKRHELSWQQTFGEIASWQRMLERYGDLFAAMQPGSRIGILPRETSDSLPGGERPEGRRIPAGLPMMIWQVAEGGMSARIERFEGMSSPQVDLLLVADANAMKAMVDAMEGDMLAVIRRLVRRGSLMFFVFRTRGQLQDAGYEDFFDSFGLVFLGACR